MKGYSSCARSIVTFDICLHEVCVQVGVRFVITKFSRMDSLQNFVAHGAPLRALRVRESSTRNKRSLRLETRETASYILFSAKTQIYKQNTCAQSGVEKSLFPFSLCLLIEL